MRGVVALRVSYFDIAVDADVENLGKVRSLISEVLKSSIDVTLHNKILTCFSEVFTNSVEHGNATGVEASAYRQNGKFYLSIRDNGRERLPDVEAMSSMGPFDLEKESGRGLAIVRSMSGEMCEAREDGKNIYLLSWGIALEDARKKVLLVDDDRAITALYEQYLNDDFNVFVANSVVHALTQLNSMTPDIVISDINMPDVNGIEFRRRLLKSEKEGLFPFVFLTMDDGSYIEDAIQVGIDDYIQKPITRCKLISTINRVLTRFQHLRNGFNKRINREISSALLPSLPENIFGFHVCSKSFNTGAGGGDLVVFHKTDRAAYIVLVDVMGHDDAAKFFSYAYAGFLRGSLLVSDDVSPALLLQNLSKQVFLDSFLSQFNLTCCIVKIFCDGKVEAASAGHPAPLRISDDGLSFVPVQGMMLGLMEDARYTTVEVEMKKGERLALYTDGLFEGVGSPESRQSLEQCMLEAIGLKAESLEKDMDRCMGVFCDAIKNTPTDDALLILMECESI